MSVEVTNMIFKDFLIKQNVEIIKIFSQLLCLLLLTNSNQCLQISIYDILDLILSYSLSVILGIPINYCLRGTSSFCTFSGQQSNHDSESFRRTEIRAFLRRQIFVLIMMLFLVRSGFLRETKIEFTLAVFVYKTFPT